MRRVLASSAVAALVLLAQPVKPDAQGLDSFVRHTFSAPGRIFGGLAGARHRASLRHRHAGRGAGAAAPPRTATRNTETPGGQEPGGSTATAAPNAAHAAHVAPPAGPWISAYDDLFGYVLAPGGNADPFWQHGAPDLYAVLMAPGRGDAASGATCPARRPDGIVGWPMAKVVETLKPTDAQRRALDELRASLEQAFDRAQASCFAAWPASAEARIEALRRRVEALQTALRMVRGPLEALNASLTDEQKARLNAASRKAIVDGNPPAADAGRTNAACAGDTGPTIQQTAGALFATVRPTAEQRPGLEVLAGTFGHVADMMKTSCPVEMPLTPMGRLNAAEKRLRVMAYAISIVRGPLGRFYAALDDGQKTRFDAGAATGDVGRVGMRPNG